MFLEGHYSVLRELEAGDPSIYKGWPLVRSRYSFKHSLKTGMSYPDLPCSTPHADVNTGRVGLKVFRLCSQWKLFDMFQQSIWGRPVSKLTERYMSHLGSQAHMHAMAHNPHSTADDIAYRTCRQMLVLTHRAHEAVRAGDRSYPHWVGMLLHTVTDAYTPSHAQRRAGGGSSDQVEDAAAMLDDALYRLAKATAEAPLSKADLRKVLGSKGAGGVSVYRAYLRYVMLHQSLGRIREVVPDLRAAYDNAVARAHSAGNSGRPVERFWHYQSQTTIEHMIGDLGPEAVSRREMIDCCASLLHTMRSSLSSSAEGGQRELLLGVLDILVSGPLRIRVAGCRCASCMPRA